jgi:formylglycine-generating enzyme required for sulfatase activity
MTAVRPLVRVLVATTEGPVEITGLHSEPPELGRSVACIAGTTQLADISQAYDAFVARPTGMIERLFERRSYRLDLAAPIDSGASWQLGVLAAHGLQLADRLAMAGQPADIVVLATGTVGSLDLGVGPVAHIADKARRALPRLKEARAAGAGVIVALPPGAASEIDADTARALKAAGISVLEVAHADTLFERLGLAKLEPAGARQAKPLTPRQGQPVRGSAPPWLGKAAAGALLGFALLGAALWSGWPGASRKSSAAQQAASMPKPRTVFPDGPFKSFRDCDDCPEMVPLPAGKFMMGAAADDPTADKNELAQSEQVIAHPFAIGRFEVTVDEFQAFAHATGFKPAEQCLLRILKTAEPGVSMTVWAATYRTPGFPVTGRHPAVCISIHEAKAYTAWLAQKTGRPYRLPVEVEWEYAARAGTTARFIYSDRPDRLCEFARFADLSSPLSYGETCHSGFSAKGPLPVGTLKSNPWGLYDMLGNVAEFVVGCLKTGEGVSAPLEQSQPMPRVCTEYAARGGGWGAQAVAVRVTRRIPVGTLQRRVDTIGFRVALSLTR